MKHFLQAITFIFLSIIAGKTAPAQKPKLVTQTGHLESIHAFAISPDKKILASAGADKTIIIWNIAQGKQIYSLKGHSQWIFSLSFNTDGHLLASGSADGTVKIWDIVRGIKIEEIPLPQFEIKCVAFSSDSNTLAISGEDKVIRLWHVKTRKLKSDLTGHNASVSKVAFSSDDKYLVSISRDKTLKLWNIETTKIEQQVKFEQRFETLAYSPDGNFIAIAGIDGFVGFWNLRTGKLKIKPSPKGLSYIKSLAYISDNELAIVGNGLSIWNYETGDLRELGDSVTGDGSNTLGISKDKKLLAFNDGMHIKLYDLNTNQPKELKGGFSKVSTILFSSSEAFLAAGVGNKLRTWGDRFNVSEQEEFSIVAYLLGIRYVYISSIDVIATFGEIDGGYGSPNIELIKDSNPKSNRIIEAHKASINSIAVNNDGTILASSSEDGTMKIWDVKNWTPKKILQESAKKITFNHDGSLLATVDSNNSIKLWNTSTWEYKVIPNKEGVRSILFSPNGKVLAIAGWTQRSNLILWEVATLKLLSSFSLDSTPKNVNIGFFGSTDQSLSVVFGEMAGSSKTFGTLSFSPDSSMVACVEINYKTADYKIKIWSVETFKEISAMSGHSATIRSTTFSPNNSVLASGSWDTTIKLWNTKTGKELATISPIDDKKWVIYTPDGRFDTNVDLEDDDIIHWSIPGDALNTLPLDVFIRDYYEPKLFERLINCTEKDTCKQEFKETRSLSELNIVRPNVKITDVSLPDTNRYVNVTVEVSKASGFLEQDTGQQIERTTDVYDLRLFRDKQLVSDAPFDGAEQIERRKMEIENSALNSKFETELKIWRESTKVLLDSQTGKQSISFKVQLPKGKDASDVKFTAYAFNEDRVKSETAKYEWTAEQKAKLPKADLSIKRRAYIFSIGVNDSNPDTKLIFAASDADKFQKVVPEKLRQVGNYDVIPIQLTTANENSKLIVNATKQNIKTVFDLLAGKDVPLETKNKIPSYEQIKKSTPDDLIIINYSGHGYSNYKDFYLVLSDSVGKSRQVQSHNNLIISGEELALWLRYIEMNQMAFIIDACQSAAVVESLDFKPGPLGSRGFGQLAYDKRLRVLVAAQSANNALEDGKEIKGGLLTYALIDEGLVAGEADSDSEKDGKITLDEWLQYGESQVPSLFKETIKDKDNQQTLVTGNPRKLSWKTLNNNYNFTVEQQTTLQRATFFNFSRQNSDIWLFNTKVGEKK